MKVCFEINFKRFAKIALYWLLFIPGIITLIIVDSHPQNETCKFISKKLYAFEVWVWYQ